MILLAADIGGTNSRLQLVDDNETAQQVVYEEDYASAEYASFYDVLQQFRTESGNNRPIDAACIAVAGPVKALAGQLQASVTNLPWRITEKELLNTLQTSAVKLINDFSAVCYGLTELIPSDIEILQAGISATSQQPSAVVIGAGTGLGVAHKIYIHDGYHVLPTESGHAGFTPESALQTQLLTCLQSQQSHVSLESVLSGRGFQLLYDFLKQTLDIDESAAIKARFAQTDPAQVITSAGLDKTDLLCEQALNLFVDIYGAAAGNLALNHYPVDEVYIAGGIAPKIRSALHSERFLAAFNNKGLMKANLQALPIKLVTQDRVGLLGALAVARQLLC